MKIGPMWCCSHCRLPRFCGSESQIKQKLSIVIQKRSFSWQEPAGARPSWGSASGRPGWKGPRCRWGFRASVTSEPTACTHNIYNRFRRIFQRVQSSRARRCWDWPLHTCSISLARPHGLAGGLRFLLRCCSANVSRGPRPHRSASTLDCFAAQSVALKCFYCCENVQMEWTVKHEGMCKTF